MPLKRLMILGLAALACSLSGSCSDEDGAHDAGVSVDSGGLADATVVAAEDAGGAAADAGAAPDSSISGADAGGIADASGVAPWDPQGKPKGQCVKNGDCFWGLPCDMGAPGGVCSTCTLPDDCGDPFEMDCVDGSCQRLCPPSKPSCPRGLRCDTQLNACAFIPCGSGLPACPAPYVCEGTRCARPKCASTTPTCPTGMYCAGSYCVENYQ